LLSHFDKITHNNHTVYINKDFRNEALEKALLAGEKELKKRYQTESVFSCDTSCVYRCSVKFDNMHRVLYFKRYLRRTIWDPVKDLVRGSRAKRDFNATLMLSENGFEAPTVVAMGECTSGIFLTENFLVTLEVENAKQVYQVNPGSSENPTKEQLRSKRNLIKTLGQTVGRMHAKGIFHGDLKTVNVLARHDKNVWRFCFIDNERTKKFSILPWWLRLKNLVQLNMHQSAYLTNSDHMRFFKAYLSENPDIRHNWKRWTRKIVAKTNRRLQICTGRHVAVFLGVFHSQGGLLDFIQRIDDLIDEGQIIKDDLTSSVSRITWNGRDIIVKRYNHKGFFHSLRHTIKKSRARRGWACARQLGKLGIEVPRPLAYIEQRNGPLVWKSYLVTDFVEGQELYGFLRDSTVTKELRSKVTQQMVGLLDRLDRHMITHGDLKHSNILIADGKPFLTDFDGIKMHKLRWTYTIRREKDLKRLVLNWDELGARLLS
jgi:tRNA A-37 threonylcarbamoyl transferase component Bud32